MSANAGFSEYRVRVSGDPSQISCGADGPALGPIRFLTKSASGFEPRGVDELNALLGWTFGHPVKCDRLLPGLQTIAKALDHGEIARAMIATQFLHLTPLDDRQSRRAAQAVEMFKAAVDDPKHPGWPAKTPGGLGGKYRPKDAEVNSAAITEAGRIAAQHLTRLILRRAIRAALRAILTWRRVARLGIEAASNAVPILDALGDAAMAVDLANMGEELATLEMQREKAVAFAKNGPYTLDQLRVDRQDRTFSSFAEFKKVDLIKIYKPAPPGMQYHHIVEQGDGDDFPANEIQSTRNIILIPTLLHEEINSEYALSGANTATGVSIRDSLRGHSFKKRWQQGLETLRKIGILQ